MTVIPVPEGHLASIVTYLEMTRRPELSDPETGALEIRRWANPALSEYRALFRTIGLPWLWMSRLVMDSDAVEAIIHHGNVEIFKIADEAGTVIGMIELDYRIADECEIGFLGLIPEYSGQGHGHWLMHWILQQAWSRKGVRRVWLHTCSFDHPGALQFYRKHGFSPFRREIEIIPDPRLSGKLPRSAGPHVPIIEA